MGRSVKRKFQGGKSIKTEKNDGELFCEELCDHMNIPKQEIEDNSFDFGMVNYITNKSNYECTTNVELRDALTQASNLGT
ncbi:unnamed protein product [Brachionus calyciflorus]|uniref:Uncharacterized protein n=1 Tax=Brachionus calyciflorus TaxID=104777 RepID=A0A813ZQP0_9BILA|nr:unnamed protein product [Brachionus calyciflorus]